MGGRVVPGAYPPAARSVLLVNRGDRFEAVTEQLAPGLRDAGIVSGALWSDVDSDGWIDLFVTLQWGTPRCWRNLGGERFEEASEALGFTAAGAGWWNSIASADFNGDGQPDYVVGNVGPNTRYQASCDRPMVLLRGAMDAAENSRIFGSRGSRRPARARARRRPGDDRS